MNNILNLTKGIQIALKNEWSFRNTKTIGVDYIRVNNMSYYNDCSGSKHLTINNLLIDSICNKYHELIENELNKPITTNDQQLFINYFPSIIYKYNVDIDKSIDVIFNELFVNFKKKLSFEYSFNSLLDGKIEIINHGCKFDLSTMLFDNIDKLITNEFKQILLVLKVLKSINGNNEYDCALIDFINILRFKQGKKTLYVEKTKVNICNTGIWGILRILKDTPNRYLKHSKQTINLKYLDKFYELYQGNNC